MRLDVDDLVEIRSAEEILQTLDEKGCLDGMPFMPEMLRYCGKQFPVLKSAHKTCDTIERKGIRRVADAVHLNTPRCDGSAHGGCEAACGFFWKTAWIKPVGRAASRPVSNAGKAVCTVESLQANTQRVGDGGPGDIRYVCQITELLKATTPGKWWNPFPYLRDVTSGNYSFGHLVGVMALASLRSTIRNLKGYALQVRLYNAIAKRLGKADYDTVAHWKGAIPSGGSTPKETLVDLKVGDMVRVKSMPEITATLNTRGQNRGLYFDTDMVPYCNQKRRVIGIVKRLIDEPTGKMVEMKGPCYTLEGVICNGEYSDKRLMCPRHTLSYWRPMWLEKVADE